MSFQAYLDEMSRLRRPELGNLALIEELASTNLLARRIAKESIEEGICPARSWIVAYRQTEGRGRQGRSWVSPAGAGVYATLILPLGAIESPASDPLATLPLLTAVAICEAVNGRCDLTECRLKWPNDLLVEGAKLGGVLIETFGCASDQRVALVGFGVNHSPGQQAEVNRATTTLHDHCSQPPSLAELTYLLLTTVDERLRDLGDAARAIDSYQELSAHQVGSTLRCRQGEEYVEGTFLGFDPRGFLRLEVAGEERLLAAGEVLDS